MPLKRASITAPAPASTSAAAASAPFTCPWCHWTSEPIVNAARTKRPTSVARRRAGVERMNGRQGRIAKAIAIDGAR